MVGVLFRTPFWGWLQPDAPAQWISELFFIAHFLEVEADALVIVAQLQVEGFVDGRHYAVVEHSECGGVAPRHFLDNDDFVVIAARVDGNNRYE